MRISDWSSDVCSSDLRPVHPTMEATANSIEAASPTSRVAARALPCPPIASATWPAARASMSVTRTDAPCSAKRLAMAFPTPPAAPVTRTDLSRSEEHTSELQSLMRISYAVFCLKKKTTQTHIQMTKLKHN